MMAAMAILSIQSAVAYGHVGNAAAVFPLQRLGFEVWAVDTVQFSNHTGYGAWRGRAWDAATIAEVIRGIAELGVLGDCAAVLSGYLGEPALGEAVLDAVGLVKQANPGALYCCDPVIGDDGRGVFVRPGIAEFFRDHACREPTSSRRTASNSSSWPAGRSRASPRRLPPPARCAPAARIPCW
jgi:pyridoxine kinase